MNVYESWRLDTNVLMVVFGRGEGRKLENLHFLSETFKILFSIKYTVGEVYIAALKRAASS